MDIRVLRYFLAVAREESVTRAAHTLHVTQPTLSRQLIDLEAELGKPLFIRGSRKLFLTEEGMLLRKRAEEIVALMEKTETELRGADEAVFGDVYIGCGETEAMRLIARAAKKLEESCPQIRYHLFSGNAEDVTERLEKGLLDFGLLVGVKDLSKYDYLKLPAWDTWGVIMREDSKYAQLTEITPETLAELPLFCSRQALVRNDFSNWLGAQLDRLNVVGTYNLIYNAAVMVEEGLGYALCLDKLVDTTGLRGLCFKPLEPELTAGLVLVWKKHQMFSKAAERFLNILQKELS